MPRLFESSVEALLPNPVYLLGLLIVLAVVSVVRRWRRGPRFLVAALAAWSLLLSMPGVSRVLIDRLESRFPAVDAMTVAGDFDILLLASGSMERYRGRDVARLDLPAWERTRAAAALWKQASDARLIILGGPHENGHSPSTAMADVAVALGVPRQAILVDDRAATTLEGFEIIDPAAVTLRPRTWLVTSAIHMPRSMLAARATGLRLTPFPCDYIATDAPGWYQWVPSTLAYRLNVEVLHEYVGLLTYSLRTRSAIARQQESQTAPPTVEPDRVHRQVDRIRES